MKVLLKISCICLLLLSLGISRASAQSIKPHINHLSICVTSLEASMKFYKTVMLLDEMPNPFSDKVHQWLRIGPQTEMHLQEDKNCTKQHFHNDHMAFSVPSIEDFIKHLDKQNITYGDWSGPNKKTQTRPDGVKQIYLQDPDGYWIEVNNAK